MIADSDTGEKHKIDPWIFYQAKIPLPRRIYDLYVVHDVGLSDKMIRSTPDPAYFCTNYNGFYEK
ncbi:unnamed protein product, partial [Amoebophrya sp. A25]|eukprot:GSA25T00000537001.1